jgi:hypothetical protein
MKLIVTLIAGTIITLLAISIFSSNSSTAQQDDDKYCAKMKDGMTVVMHEGNQLTTEVKLTNGTKILSDATVIKSDSTKITLQEGECINKDGVMSLKRERNNPTGSTK